MNATAGKSSENHNVKNCLRLPVLRLGAFGVLYEEAMNRFAGLTVVILILFLTGCGSFPGGWGDNATVEIAVDGLQIKAVATFYGDGVYMTDQDYFVSAVGMNLVIKATEMGQELQWSLIDEAFKSFDGDELYSSELMNIVSGAIRANNKTAVGGQGDLVNIHGRWYKKAIFDTENGLEYYYDVENNMITLVKSQGLVARTYEFRKAGDAKMVIPAIIEVFEYNGNKVAGDKVFKVKFTKVVN